MLYKNKELEEFSGRQTKQFEDWSGRSFGDWYLICRAPNTKKRHSCFWCECKCGSIYTVHKSALRSGLSKKCRKCVAASSRGKGQNFYGGTIIPVRYWRSTVRGARLRSISFDITVQEAYDIYLNQDKKCKLSGLEIGFNISQLTMKNGWKSHFYHTASLDRIDSSKGYSVGNVQWLHKDVNKMKSNFKQEHFIKLCKLISFDK